jgi:hypothetical protein
MPTSRTERVPSAAVIAASWDAPGLAVEAVSDIDFLCCRGIAAFCATYTTPADTVARVSCNGEANMLVVPLISMVNSPA